MMFVMNLVISTDQLHYYNNISEHTSSGMSVNIDIELSILSMLYNQTYILYLISCTYFIKYCIIIIYYYH